MRRFIAATVVAGVGTGVFMLVRALLGPGFDLESSWLVIACACGAFGTTFGTYDAGRTLRPSFSIVAITLLGITIAFGMLDASTGEPLDQVLQHMFSIAFWELTLTSWWLLIFTALLLAGLNRMFAVLERRGHVRPS